MDTPYIIKSAEHKSSNWSGGTTTELFIYPPESDFAQRNFQFRLSTATVELPRTEFTPLANFKRLLLVLEGETRLTHEGHHSKKIGRFEVDEFDGGWTTVSDGECVDFNIIYDNAISADAKGISLLKGDWLRDIILVSKFVFVYCYSGTLIISFKQKDYQIYAGDLWCLQDVEEQAIAFEAQSDAAYVYVKLFNL